MPDDPDPTMLTDAELRAAGAPDSMIPYRNQRPTGAQRDRARLVRYRKVCRELTDAHKAIALVTKDDTVRPEIWVVMLERATLATKTLIELVESDDDD
jgi:hypothetical protein